MLTENIINSPPYPTKGRKIGMCIAANFNKYKIFYYINLDLMNGDSVYLYSLTRFLLCVSSLQGTWLLQNMFRKS